MQSFVFHNPVKILFGEGQTSKLGRAVPPAARVLLVYGGGSIRQNGIYDAVLKALGDRPVSLFGGIEPNPLYETAMRAVAQGRQDGSNFVLAVGGGSVIDAAKFIAAALCHDGEAWDLVARKAPVRQALPLGCVLTLPATGSEMNGFSVMSRAATGEKLGFGAPQLMPVFSVLDPKATASLPPRQLGNGIVDSFVHVTEQYLTVPAAGPLQDRQAEAILSTLIEIAPEVMAADYRADARASLMWCACNALNGLIGCGVPQDWATHMVGHELTALTGLDHARTLAVVLPAMLKLRREAKQAKLLQYAARVWGLDERAGSADERIDAAIARTEVFFESVGVSTRLSAYGVDAGPLASAVADRLSDRGDLPLGEAGDVDAALVRAVIELAA